MNIDKKIFIFYHATLINDWKTIIEEQKNILIRSKLSSAMSNLYFGLYGNNEDMNDVINEFKCVFPSMFVYGNSRYDCYEYYILSTIKDFVELLKEECYIFYFHSKGITAMEEESKSRMKDWRDLMQHFLIKNWKSCIEKLEEGYDCCGVNWHVLPKPHFSGNFWWANSEYLKKLPNVDMLDKREHEFWIGLKQPRLYCFYESNVDHYRENYSSLKYELKNEIKT